MNVRGAFLHLVADAAVSAGVVVAGLVVWRTGWTWVDPVTSRTTEVALTAHLVLPWPAAQPAFLSSIRHELEHRFGIHHITLQVEDASAVDCAQASPDSI